MDDKLSLLLQCRFDALTHEAQREVYIQFYQDVYGIVIYMTNDHAAAEDIIQESFLKVIRHVPEITNEQSFRGWIRVIVKNTIYSYLRKIKKNRNDIDSDSVYINNTIDYATEPDSISKEVELKMMEEEISSYLLKMKPEYRAIVELRWKHGLSYKEIAEQLDTTDQIIKHKLHRARDSIRKRFTKDWGE